MQSDRITECPASVAQREALESWGVWRDGTSFGEANTMLVTLLRLRVAMENGTVPFTLTYREA